MIVPMAKYNFLVYHREVEKFLSDLMELGVVHVIPEAAATDEAIEALAADIRTGENVVKRFEKMNVRLKPEKVSEDWKAFHILSESADLESEYTELESQQLQLQKDIELLEPWGEIPWGRIRALRDAGIQTRFFHYPENKFLEEWAGEFALEVINRTNNQVYFLIFFTGDELEFPAAYVALPPEPLASIREKLEMCRRRREEIKKTLNEYAASYLPHLKEHIVAAQDDLNFKMVGRNLNSVDSLKLVVVSGWCPVSMEAALQAHLAKNRIVYTVIQDTGDEKPPVLLKNNRFARLFEPIGRMFSLPSYNEMDLTPLFAPFFLLFFGFCLGDAGYGIVILIAATVAKVKIKKKYKPFATLMQLFALSTIVMGFVTGTFFGVELIKVAVLEPVRSIILTQDQLFTAALAIGFFQIIFGLSVSVYKKIVFEGWIYSISKLGWIVLLLSLLDIMLLKKLGTASAVTAYTGAGMIVFFGNPKAGILKSFGTGLADLYNITGVMGDLLSYIRLFALGVSSAILGLVVNSIALSAKGIPYVGIAIMIIILVVGHSANLLLASLSSFVHPMRLTFVEFYKNTGFDGGGKPYQPFERKVRRYREEQG